MDISVQRWLNQGSSVPMDPLYMPSLVEENSLDTQVLPVSCSELILAPSECFSVEQSTLPSETSLGRCRGSHNKHYCKCLTLHIIINSTLKSCNSQNGSHLGIVVTGQEYVCSQKRQLKLQNNPYSAPYITTFPADNKCLPILFWKKL
ncbi:hypothetical protein YC2023_062253 [Brassica napus]